jgi:hypothetical protein
MSQIYASLYLATLAFLIVVPGSALVLFKAALLGSFALVSGALLLFRGTKRIYIVGAFFWLAIVLFWWWLGFINNDVRAAAREGVAYLVFAVTALFLVAHYRYIPNKWFRWTVMGAFMLYAVVKIGFLYMVLSGRINPMDAAEMMEDFAPGAAVTGWRGDGGVPRFVMSNDYLLPVFVGWLLLEWRSSRIGRGTFILLLSVALFLIAIALSRYLYAFTAGLLIAYLLYFHAQAISFARVGAGIGMMMVLGYAVLMNLGYGDLLERRISGGSAASSDAAKLGQIAPLIDLIDSAPVLGHGYGLSMESTGRGNFQSFQAELQWFGLTAKIGLFGMFSVLLVLGLYLHRVLFSWRNSLATRLFVATIFVFWLFAGFFNPVLLLSTTAVNVLIIYAMHVQLHVAGNKPRGTDNESESRA